MFICDVPFTETNIIIVSSKYQRDEINKLIINTVSEWHNILRQTNNLKLIKAIKRSLLVQQVPKLGCDHYLLSYVVKKLTDTCDDIDYKIEVRKEL